MDGGAFRQGGEEMLQFIAEYWDTMRQRRPLHNVTPGKVMRTETTRCIGGKGYERRENVGERRAER